MATTLYLYPLELAVNVPRHLDGAVPREASLERGVYQANVDVLVLVVSFWSSGQRSDGSTNEEQYSKASYCYMHEAWCQAIIMLREDFS